MTGERRKRRWEVFISSILTPVLLSFPADRSFSSLSTGFLCSISISSPQPPNEHKYQSQARAGKLIMKAQLECFIYTLNPNVPNNIHRIFQQMSNGCFLCSIPGNPQKGIS